MCKIRIGALAARYLVKVKEREDFQVVTC